MPELPVFTGTQVNYYLICKRKLWLFSNGNDDELESIAQRDAATQAGCILEDLAPDFDDGNDLLKGGLDEDSLPDYTASNEEQRAVISRRPIPINDVEAFFLFGETDLNTKLLNLLARHKVPLHVLNYYGFYSGSFYPRQEINSRFLLVKQCELYGCPKRRLQLAQKLVDGASFNIIKNLKYYGANSRGRDMSPFIEYIERARAQIATTPDVNSCMGIEGTIRAKYYEAWALILSTSWAQFQKRVKRPPDNPVNALISFSKWMRI